MRTTPTSAPRTSPRTRSVPRGSRQRWCSSPTATRPRGASSPRSRSGSPRSRAEGEFLLRARLLLPPDQPRAPAPAGVPITVTPPARVLLVSGLARPVVAVALTRRGADVDVVPPAALAARLGELADYHAVVLDDVARAGLGDETLERLRVYVARGGALIATGGERLFGEPGFAERPRARRLPG